MSKNFRGLTKKQAEVFEQIATNNDAGHPSRVLGDLLQFNLIESYTEVLPCNPPVKITGYRVPLAVHIEWCEWCAKTV